MTCHNCINPTCADGCNSSTATVTPGSASAPELMVVTRYREAIEALIYAVENPGSNQAFAIEAGHQALAQQQGSRALYCYHDNPKTQT
jgi:hypothetical protein